MVPSAALSKNGSSRHTTTVLLIAGACKHVTSPPFKISFGLIKSYFLAGVEDCVGEDEEGDVGDVGEEAEPTCLRLASFISCSICSSSSSSRLKR